MAGRFFILQHVADFAPGFFENTVVEDGAIQLAFQDGIYPEKGCYTTAPFQSETFYSLIPSWNAATPRGTWVEIETRISSGGRWSKWFSFGKWSPYIQRQTPKAEGDETAQFSGDVLTVADGMPGADMLQLRIWLYSEHQSASPRVRLLSASTNAAQQMQPQDPVFNRVLPVPEYSCLNRDPKLGARIASATAITMLMNRWGRDLLPEEIARCAYDWQSGRYDRLSFLCAAAAMHGFRCYVSYTPLAALKREVWQGHAVAARVHYRVPAEGGASFSEIDPNMPPILDGAIANSYGHLVVVHGFVKREDSEFVLVKDPLANTNEETSREIPFQQFARMYTGLAMFMHRGIETGGTARPKRRLAQLKLEDDAIFLYDGETEILPAMLKADSEAALTVCCTLASGAAFASAAQQQFYYPELDGEGLLRLDVPELKKHKLTVYCIGAQGNSWVGEKLPALDI